MGDEITPNSSRFSWRHFAGKMPANNIFYNISRAREDERRARFGNAAEKIIMIVAGIEPLTSR
jgi:hypothetical protein